MKFFNKNKQTKKELYDSLRHIINEEIKLEFRIGEVGFLTYKTHKLDGSISGNIFFKKYTQESWEQALKNAIIDLKNNNETIKNDITITFFTKL